MFKKAESQGTGRPSHSFSYFSVLVSLGHVAIDSTYGDKRRFVVEWERMCACASQPPSTISANTHTHTHRGSFAHCSIEPLQLLLLFHSTWIFNATKYQKSHLSSQFLKSRPINLLFHTLTLFMCGFLFLLRLF